MYHVSAFNVSSQDNLKFLKMWFQNVFSIDWNTVMCPSRVFRRVLLRGKNCQNWGFEITNVRYGHQPAFCPHFNDGSNSRFQTTNWNAPQAGYLSIGKHFNKLWTHVLIKFWSPYYNKVSLIILIANSRPSWVGAWRACKNFEVQILPKWVFNQLLSFERAAQILGN